MTLTIAIMAGLLTRVDRFWLTGVRVGLVDDLRGPRGLPENGLSQLPARRFRRRRDHLAIVHTSICLYMNGHPAP